MISTRLAVGMSVFLAVSAGAAPAIGADTPYPTRPIRLIVTFVPGGGVDFVARALGGKLTESWRQQVIVDNRAGGGGIIGTETAARAAPDGYTLLLGTSSGLIANPLLQKNIPYDAYKDFSPITLLVITTQMLVVHPALPVNSVRDVIAYARKEPGKLTYASAGVGAPNHLGMELFKSMTGTNIVHVPYKGAGLATTDLIAGQVQIMFNPAAPLLPHVSSGRLKALAVGNDKRSRILPDLPTVAEAGVPGFVSAPWYALYAPARTPVAVINALNAEVIRILSDETFAQFLTSNGAEPRTSTPAELTSFMRQETERLRKLIAVAAIRSD